MTLNGQRSSLPQMIKCKRRVCFRGFSCIGRGLQSPCAVQLLLFFVFGLTDIFRISLLLDFNLNKGKHPQSALFVFEIVTITGNLIIINLPSNLFDFCSLRPNFFHRPSKLNMFVTVNVSPRLRCRSSSFLPSLRRSLCPVSSGSSHLSPPSSQEPASPVSHLPQSSSPSCQRDAVRTRL